MKKYILLSIIFLFTSVVQLFAQLDTRGTDFWVTFGRATVLNVPTIRIAAGDQPVTGTIYFTNLGTSISFSIPAGGIYNYRLSSSEGPSVESQIAGKSNRSAHITSSTPVTAYTIYSGLACADATYILPVTALGTDYFQISYKQMSGSGIDWQDAYGIVATQNNTQVYHNGTLTTTLNTGEVYYYTSTTDMTGAHITADKPIAFFAMNEGAQIPNGIIAADNLFEQLAPVNTWGKNFFVPISKRGKDIVRIVASQNNTIITQSGGTVLQGSLTLNAGQYVELVVPLSNNGCYIQANKPVGVCTYLTGANYNGTDKLSDPSQAWVPPIEQKTKSALIAPFNFVGEECALIVTSTATKNNTTVKIGSGTTQALSGGTWYDNASSGMSFYNIPLTNSTSSYLFSNQAGLTVMGYGMWEYQSIYYLAASSMRTVDAVFYVNDINYQDLASQIICSPAQFRAEIAGDLSTVTGHLKWYINNVEEISVQDQLSWSKNLSNGTYQIKMIALLDDNITTKTVESMITISSCTGTITTSCETVCEGAGSVTLTLNGYIGTITKWQYSFSPFSSWTDINQTTENLVIENLPQAARFRAVVNGSNTTDYVAVSTTPKPVVSFTGSTTICAGSTTTLSPTTGGTWVSNNPSVATVTNAGVVTGVSSGSVTFTYTRTDGCSASVTP